jgi:hypothetical protein
VRSTCKVSWAASIRCFTASTRASAATDCAEVPSACHIHHAVNLLSLSLCLCLCLCLALFSTIMSLHFHAQIWNFLCANHGFDSSNCNTDETLILAMIFETANANARDGIFFHYTKKNMDRDRDRDNEFKEQRNETIQVPCS